MEGLLEHRPGVPGTVFRDLGNTDIPFSISSSGHLCRPFNHKILNLALLGLRFCSIRDDKSNLNLSVKPGTSVFTKSLSGGSVLIRRRNVLHPAANELVCGG